MVLDRDSLIRRLDEVSPRQKEMVILRAAGFELAEITEITGATSAKAVEGALYRLRVKNRKDHPAPKRQEGRGGERR